MALCYAVESNDTGTMSLDFNSMSVCRSPQSNNSIFQALNMEREDNRELKKSLSAALNFYGIDMDYEMSVLDSGEMACEGNSPYCCSLSPFQSEEESSLMLNVQFPKKTEYVLGRIGFMLTSSILILLFISIVFFASKLYPASTKTHL